MQGDDDLPGYRSGLRIDSDEGLIPAVVVPKSSGAEIKEIADTGIQIEGAEKQTDGSENEPHRRVRKKKNLDDGDGQQHHAHADIHLCRVGEAQLKGGSPSGFEAVIDRHGGKENDHKV